MTPSDSRDRISVPRLLVVILLARTVLNTAYRAVYPFLPFIASGLGVSLESAAAIIQSRNLIGLTAPTFGPLSDHLGRRSIMLLGLAAAALSCLLLGGFSSFFVALVAITGMALGKALYDPAQQAYLGDSVPYARRGRAMSLSETSWSAAALLGLPFMGVMVQYFGWRSGFFALGLIGLLGIGLTRLGLPASDHHGSGVVGGTWRSTFAQIARERGAVAVLVTSIVSTASNENITVIFGAWLKDSFLLGAIALGSVASAIGIAELCGELFSSGSVDRIGKHRLVRLSLLGAALAYVVLPWLARNAVLATTGLFLVFLFFEISVVSALPLVSELAPAARGTLMSLNVASFALGRTVGSFSGPFLYLGYGFTSNALVSAAGAFFAFLVWHWLVTERRDTLDV